MKTRLLIQNLMKYFHETNRNFYIGGCPSCAAFFVHKKWANVLFVILNIEAVSYTHLDKGYPVYLHDRATGSIIKTDYRLKADILDTEIPDVYIRELYSDRPEKVKNE